MLSEQEIRSEIEDKVLSEIEETEMEPEQEISL